MAALPLTDLVRVASSLDIDPVDFIALVLNRPTPTDGELDDAWELHALLLYVGGVGARHSEAAEALGWDLPRLERAARVLTAILQDQPHYDLAYHHGGRMHLRSSGHRSTTRLTMRAFQDPIRTLLISDEHAAVLRAATLYTFSPMFDAPELQASVVQDLLARGLAVLHDDGSLVLSPDAELSTTAQPLPAPES